MAPNGKPETAGDFVCVTDTDGDFHVVNFRLIQEFYFPPKSDIVHVVGANYTITISLGNYEELVAAIYHLS